jgi:phage-related protein
MGFWSSLGSICSSVASSISGAFSSALSAISPVLSMGLEAIKAVAQVAHTVLTALGVGFRLIVNFFNK